MFQTHLLSSSARLNFLSNSFAVVFYLIIIITVCVLTKYVSNIPHLFLKNKIFYLLFDLSSVNCCVFILSL